MKYPHRRFCGVAITTNHIASGIYIPPGDRRYDVIETATFVEMGLTDQTVRRTYFEELYEWFLKGGDQHVAAFLHERDLSRFSPDHGQRKTAAHQEVVAANLEADSWLNDILSELGDPLWIRADVIFKRAVNGGEREGDVRRKLAPSMERADYVKHRNPKRPDGRWYPERNAGVTIYRKLDATPLSVEQFTALVKGGEVAWILPSASSGV